METKIYDWKQGGRERDTVIFRLGICEEKEKKKIYIYILQNTISGRSFITFVSSLKSFVRTKVSVTFKMK